jgi:hypothetical protein
MAPTKEKERTGNPLDVWPDKDVPPAHSLEGKKGDPRVNGPYLDDIRAEQEDAYRARRGRKGITKKEIKQHMAADPDLSEEDAEARVNSVDRNDKQYEDELSETLTSHPSATAGLERIRPSDGDVFVKERNNEKVDVIDPAFDARSDAQKAVPKANRQVDNIHGSGGRPPRDAKKKTKKATVSVAKKTAKKTAKKK